MGKREILVEYAKKFIGVPYLWGGTTPEGFDCSGFVQYVFKNGIGVDLTRTTYTQVGEGTGISYSNVRLGDLIFTYNCEHVGIYVGNGEYINATQPGDVVRVTPITGGIYAVRDIIGEEESKENIPQYILPTDDRVRDVVAYTNVKTYVYQDKGSKYLTTLDKGEKLIMYRVEGDWIHCYNRTGISGTGTALYILKNRVNIPVKLQPEMKEDINQYFTEFDDRVRDISGYINVKTYVYKDKGTTLLTTLDLGTIVQMYRVEGDWLHCYNRTGISGSGTSLYVLRNRVNIPVRVQPEMKADVKQYISEMDDRVRDIEGYINVTTDVYKDKGTTRLTTLKLGTTVKMYRVEGDWIHCYNNTGISGSGNSLYVLRNRVNIPVKLQPEITPVNN